MLTDTFELCTLVLKHGKARKSGESSKRIVLQARPLPSQRLVLQDKRMEGRSERLPIPFWIPIM